ncbi:MAG: hypothetical protein KAI64_06245 [Thermoplasmata archaeon]|nr:hypothetical protein [Thermoplasmata archaeon]
MAESLTDGFGLSIIARPYEINSVNVGVIGIVGPMRLRYRQLIPLLSTLSSHISEQLTAIYGRRRIVFDKDLPYKMVTGAQTARETVRPFAG